MITDTKSYFAAGAGATFDFNITDAIFLPLAARQILVRPGVRGPGRAE